MDIGRLVKDAPGAERLVNLFVVDEQMFTDVVCGHGV